MLRSVFILILFFVTGQAHAQNTERESMVGFACSIGGTPTGPVVSFNRLLLSATFDSIPIYLESGNSGERYLALITLERLELTGRYSLNPHVEALMAQIRKSSEIVYVCSGCTIWEEIPMAQLLTTYKDLIGTSYWLDEMIPFKE